MGFGRGKGFSPVIPPAVEPEPGFWTDDCQMQQDQEGFFCQYWNAGSQIFTPDHSYAATGLTLLLSQYETTRKGPLIVKIELLATNCWEAEVIWSKGLYSTDLPPPTVYSSTYLPLPNLEFVNSLPYRITVHTLPGWLWWNGDEWVEDEAGAAIRWRYKATTNPYPRGERWYGCNFRDENGAWAPGAVADQTFCLFGITDPAVKTVDLEVAASTDDCYTYNAIIGLTSSYLYIDYATRDYHNYARFLAVPIPPGATILNAFIEICAYGATTGAAICRILGIKEPDTATFSTQADADGRAVTSAYKDWAPGPWFTATWYGRFIDSANLKTIIQEIIDQPTWAKDNALAIKIVNTTRTKTRRAYAWDYLAGTYPPRLHIEYRE